MTPVSHVMHLRPIGLISRSNVFLAISGGHGNASQYYFENFLIDLSTVPQDSAL
jgi:hypothetical protein